MPDVPVLFLSSIRWYYGRYVENIKQLSIYKAKTGILQKALVNSVTKIPHSLP